MKKRKTFAIVMALMLAAVFSFGTIGVNAASKPGKMKAEKTSCAWDADTPDKVNVNFTLRCENATAGEYALNDKIKKKTTPIENGLGKATVRLTLPTGKDAKTSKFKWRGVNDAGKGSWSSVIKVTLPGKAKITSSKNFEPGKKYTVKWNAAGSTNYYTVRVNEYKGKTLVRSSDKNIKKGATLKYTIKIKKETTKVQVYVESHGNDATNIASKKLTKK